jgi:hypothetical protein
MEDKKTVILENSTHPHILKGNAKIVKKINNMNTLVINLNGAAVVEHGQHATVRTEDDTKTIIKIIQQEFNPITKALMNACD